MKYDYKNIIFPTEPLYGRTIYLLGTAEKGPANEPILVNSVEAAIKIFGEEGSLIKAFDQISLIKQPMAIYCTKVTGTKAVAHMDVFIEQDEEFIPTRALTIYSADASDASNDISISMDDFGIYITSPDIEKYYPWNDHPNINSLVRAINHDANNNDGLVYANCFLPHIEPYELISGGNLLEFNLEGGMSYLYPTKNELYEALNVTYEVIHGAYIDFLVLLDGNINDSQFTYSYGEGLYGESSYSSPDSLSTSDEYGRPASFHGQLARFCQQQSQLGIGTHGIIGLRPSPDNLTEPYINMLEHVFINNKYGTLHFNGSKEVYEDLGIYISVVAAEGEFTDQNGDTYFANAAPLYTAFLTTVEFNRSPSNQPLPITKLKYYFNSGELKKLLSLGAVGFRRSSKNGIVVANGITNAVETSAFHLFANIRIVQYLNHLLNASVQDLIGQAIIQERKLQVLGERVSGALLRARNEGLIVEDEFTIALSPDTESATIRVFVRPLYSVEKISIVTDITFRKG